MNALIFQLGVAAPLVLSVIVYTATRREQSLIQRYLLCLLVLILAWMTGMVLYGATEPPLRTAVAILLLYLPACFMSPLFCAIMLLYARVELFETRRGARWALFAPFWGFLLAFLTDGWHGLMAGGTTLGPGTETAKAGPLFWSFQVFSNTLAVTGLAVCARIAWTSPVVEERRRMALLWAGALVPLLSHFVYTFRILPLDYPLTPASLGVTSLLLVAALRRYRLLEVQPVARRDVIEASRDAVIVADVDEHLVDLNPAASALLERTREGLAGRPLAEALDALAPTEPPDALAAMFAALRRGETPPVLELESARGQILEASVGRARSSSGGTAGYFVVLRDRTNERRAERLLQRTQRLESVGILAAGVAHEVNNPLAFVRANLSHLSQIAGVLESRFEELPKDLADQTRDLSDVIDESVTGLERIERIVRGLLGLSRTPSERVDECDLNEIVEEAARFASLDGDASVRLESHLAPQLPIIEASSDQLIQVLLNLFLNARQALRNRPDATIVASTRECGEWVEIRVADNGPGVPESLRGKIFNPFFTTRAPNEGTGLGLPIAFDIVREHGGTLEVESAEGGGACFVVRLPVAEFAARPDA